MADSQRIFDPGARFVDANGDPLAGGTLYFYQAGTSTPRTVYTDADLLTVLGTSCTLDSGGYPTTDGNTKTLIHTGLNAYKVVLKDSSGNTIATHDNIKGALDTSGFSTTYAIGTSPVVSKTAAYTILTSDKGKHFACDPTGGGFALTLPDATSAGDGFIAYVSHNADSSNPVSVLPVGSQTIGGKSAYTVGRRESAAVVCDGANWRVISDRKPFFSNLIQITDRLTAPPSSPTAGARYIINGTPTGAWSTLSFAQHDIAESDGNGSWFKWSPLDGWMAYVQDENLVTVFIDTAWTDWSNVTAPTTSALKCAVYEDFKSNGTAGGSATTGSYQTRTLNTEVKNTITGVSLASNQITLPVGTYLIHFWQTLYNVASSASKIKVISGTATPTNLYASWSNHALADSGGDNSSIYDATPSSGILTVTATAVIELQYYVASSAGAGNALGLASAEPDGSGETYARVTILDLTSVQGPAGSQGTQGTDGLDASYAYTWSTSTSGDPGSGKIAGNNATIASITQLQISETDANGASLGSAVLGSWDDSTSSVKARIIIQKEGATQNRHEFLISGAGTDQGTYWTFPVTYVATGGTISNGNSVAVNVIEKGDKGDTGATGSAGVYSFDFTFDTGTSAADPGTGKVRANNANLSSATALYINETDRLGNSQATAIQQFDDSTTTVKGYITLVDLTTPANKVRFSVSGSITDNGSYDTITVTYVSGVTSLTAVNVALLFERTGDKGADGAGSGDVTGPASATDNAIARFDSTTGKLIQNSAVTIADTTGLIAGARFANAGLKLEDTNASHLLTIAPGSDLTADRTLTVTTGDAARTLTISGDATVSQDYSSTGSPTFANPQVTTIELGHATDTTLSRSAAGKLAVEGVAVALNSITADPHIAASIELGHATDTTLSRSSAGVLAIEGVTVSLNSTSATHTAGTIELGAATDTTLSRASAGVAAVEGQNILTTGTTQTITKGFTVTPNNIGTVSSGTTTPDPANGNYQYYTNNGAHTLAAPSSDCAYDVLVTNGASAGAITFSGFTVGSSTGSALTTTNTNKFLISVRRINAVSTYSIYALQ